MKKKFALLFVLVFTLSIFAFGCQNAAQRPLNPNQPNNLNNNITTPSNQTNLTDSEAKTLAKRLRNKAEEVPGVKRASVVVSDNAMSGNSNTNNNNLPNNNLNNMGTNRNMNNNTNVGNPGTTGTPGNMNNRIVGNNPNNNNMNNVNRNNVSGIVVMVGLELNNNNLNNATNADNVQKDVASKIKASDTRISQVFVTTDASLMQRIDNVATDIANGKTINAVRTDINNLWRNLTAQGPAF